MGSNPTFKNEFPTRGGLAALHQSRIFNASAAILHVPTSIYAPLLASWSGSFFIVPLMLSPKFEGM
jgi:hypothetical protein